MRNTFLFFSLFYSTVLSAQTNSLGSWTMFFNQIRLHEKWSCSSDVQYRSYDVKPNTEQVLLRTGFNYHYNSNVSFSLGYAWVTNCLNEEEIGNTKVSNENRIWEQVMLRNNLGRLLFEHRYRFEQRWIEINNKVDYRNRLRYLVRVIIPINKKELTKNTVYANLYNETFIHLTNTPFDRNRLYGAIGFQFTSLSAVQIGYLFQTVNTTSKSYLQLGLHYNVDLRKK